MNRLLLILTSALLISFCFSCVDEHDCDDPTPPPAKENEIEDGFTFAQELDFISQLDPGTIEVLTITNNSGPTDNQKEIHIKFNTLTKIEQEVKSAKLKLVVKGTPDPSNKPYSLLISTLLDDWDENTLSYSNRPASEQKTIKLFATDSLKDQELFEIDVTSLLNDQFVNAQAHYGFGLSLDTGNDTDNAHVSFYSSDSENEDYWPALEIEYQDGSGPVTGVPEVYYSVLDNSLFSLYKAGYNSNSSDLQVELIRNGLSAQNGNSADIDVNFYPNPILYFFKALNNNNQYAFQVNSTTGINDEATVAYVPHGQVDDLLFLESNANGHYIAGRSNTGAVHLLHSDNTTGNPEDATVIYQKSVSGDVVNIIDFESLEGGDAFYWIESEQKSGKYRIMRYSIASAKAEVMFDESDFDSNFVPKAITVSNSIYLVGDTNSEKGVFYLASLNNSTVSEIDVNSNYKNNVTDLRVNQTGTHLYWMNSSANEAVGGIMRVKITGGASEIAYGKIANGLSFEIPPYAVW
ncbi:DNRLRE domain-containing protein [Rapidithrix thailandica]|uniref:DNRLRE domain-containing protein n=1 Tax=Rapidithrix thailandica TaxID=413964 RepID=A0AAW9SEY2_9BACT